MPLGKILSWFLHSRRILSLKTIQQLSTIFPRVSSRFFMTKLILDIWLGSAGQGMFGDDYQEDFQWKEYIHSTFQKRESRLIKDSQVNLFAKDTVANLIFFRYIIVCRSQMKYIHMRPEASQLHLLDYLYNLHRVCFLSYKAIPVAQFCFFFFSPLPVTRTKILSW